MRRKQEFLGTQQEIIHMMNNWQPLYFFYNNIEDVQILQEVKGMPTFNQLVRKGRQTTGRAKQEDVINFFNASLNMNLTPEGSYENGRQMKRRKGRKGMAKYDERRNIESRSYWTDDMRACLNDKWIRQDEAGDGRGVK